VEKYLHNGQEVEVLIQKIEKIKEKKLIRVHG
jgi:hypothetical protein